MNKQNKQICLGILGGLGPMSSVYFYELLTKHTLASSDAEHIDMIISSHASTPDRTAFVLGKSDDDPSGIMAADVRMLADAGADIIAIPCNTAHFFYDRIREASPVPVINIIEETVRFSKFSGAKNIGILATDGTIASDAYGKVCRKQSLGYRVPCEKDQKTLMNIIYGEIKQGREPDINAFLKIAGELKNAGCDRLILGCTELSLIKKNYGLDDFFTDSLEVLALCTILACRKIPTGFSKELLDYAGEVSKCAF